MASIIDGFQRLGRALMLPIAVLPVAGLLLRLGQPDLLDLPMLAAAGNAIFDNLGLIFAIGVAVGLARENHGAAGLAGVVGFLVATKGAEVLLAVPADVTAGLAQSAAEIAAKAYREKQLARLGVPIGVLSGLIAGLAYNRFSEIQLPSYLAFFGGRRFVPIATGCIGIVVAVAFGLAWPSLVRGMDTLSHAVLGSGSIGLFAYGLLNRILIITGLHHILNNLAWFVIGDYHGATGDLHRFFAGDPNAGAFMSGFFPVMMFGLPGACLAMYRTARPERRAAAVAGADFVPDRRHRADRVQFHVPRAGALRGARAAHGPGDGADGCPARAPRLQLLGRPVRLHPQLLEGDPAVVAAADRRVVLRPVLRAVPRLHPALQPGDAGPRAGWR